MSLGSLLPLLAQSKSRANQEGRAKLWYQLKQMYQMIITVFKCIDNTDIHTIMKVSINAYFHVCKENTVEKIYNGDLAF